MSVPVARRGAGEWRARIGSWLKRGAAKWGRRFRGAPIGVLVIATLLFFAGGGLTIAGVFYLLGGEQGSALLWLVMLPVGPLMVYVALLLVSLHPRAWTVVIALLVLMMLSSVARVLLADAPPYAPLGEVVVEALTLLYLLRPRVRRLFGR